jgi:V/A-type H+/Na+-transporting ATPase subunit K
MTDIGLIAIGAGLAFGLAALATALAQAKIGAAAVGAIVEKPESFGTMLILLVIPETLVIFGFTVAILILFTLR